MAGLYKQPIYVNLISVQLQWEYVWEYRNPHYSYIAINRDILFHPWPKSKLFQSYNPYVYWLLILKIALSKHLKCTYKCTYEKLWDLRLRFKSAWETKSAPLNICLIRSYWFQNFIIDTRLIINVRTWIWNITQRLLSYVLQLWNQP